MTTYSIVGHYDIACDRCDAEYHVTPKTLQIFCACGKMHFIRYPWSKKVVA